MASRVQTMCLLVAITVLAAAALGVRAGDPDITTDFVAVPGTTVDADFFTFRGLRGTLSGAPKNGAPLAVTKVSQAQFPALVGQSVSMAVLQYACDGGDNPPHIHQRSAELILVIEGTLVVGLVVDANNTLIIQELHVGEAFLFPKGLVHFQVNTDKRRPAVAVSAFGSSNPGLVSFPAALFGSGIDSGLLAEFFKMDDATVQKLVCANKA